MHRKEGVGRKEKRLFYFGDFSRYSPGGAGWRLYTPPVHLCPLQRTRNGCIAQAAAQSVPDARQTTQGTTHTPKRWTRWTRCTGLHSIQDRPCRADRNGGGVLGVSETVQIWTRSNMNDFQHKNVCKTIDTNTRTCYYIDNTRTCYTTTKQEDKNHEKHK